MPASQQLRRQAPKRALSDYNYALKSGNVVHIIPPDRFHEIPDEIQRLVSWGHDPAGIEIALLESDDAF